ncbi:MAG: hypothetical protein ACFB5Z_04680 [Elainellaceae cyanobacterium]
MQRPLSLRAIYKFAQSSPEERRDLLLKLQQALTGSNLALWGGATGAFGLLIWSGSLAAIAVVGLGVGLAIYLHQMDRLYVTWLPWRRWWRPANRPLTLSLLSIAGTVVVGVSLQQLWQRSPWPGLVTLVLAQTLVMALALWKRPATQQLAPAPSTAQAVEPILMALAAAHPIHQLVAIRRALRWAEAHHDAAAVDDIADCFVLMLCHHPDPIVQSALQQGLQQLTPPSLMPPMKHDAGLDGAKEAAETVAETTTETAAVLHPVHISAE